MLQWCFLEILCNGLLLTRRFYDSLGENQVKWVGIESREEMAADILASGGGMWRTSFPMFSGRFCFFCISFSC